MLMFCANALNVKLNEAVSSINPYISCCYLDTGNNVYPDASISLSNTTSSILISAPTSPTLLAIQNLFIENLDIIAHTFIIYDGTTEKKRYYVPANSSYQASNVNSASYTFTPLNPSNNLSDVTNTSTSLANLGGLSKTLLSSNILVGNSSNTATGMALTGDITINNTGITTVGSGTISLSKMANLAAYSIIGNNTSSTATPIALTPSQTKTLLSITQSDVSGLSTALSALVPYTGASSSINLNSQNLTGVGIISTGSLGYTAANPLITAQSSVTSYNQIIAQNTNTGTSASSDIVVSNNLSTDSTYYGDFGINSSTWVGAGAFNTANTVYLTATSGDLAIGTTTSNAIHFVINNGTTDAMTINTSGVISGNGSGLTSLNANYITTASYADMYANNTTTSTSIITAGTFVALTTGMSNSIASGFTFSNPILTCTVAGTYLIHWSMTVSSPNSSQQLLGGIMHNGTIMANGQSSSYFGNSGNSVNIGGTCIVSLSVNDTIRFAVTNTTQNNPVVTNYANLTITRLKN